jgi:hypothetical protein
MKYKSIQLSLIIQLIFLLLSCDPVGNLYLTNGYEYDIVLHSVYEYNGTIIEGTDVFLPKIAYPVDARHREYSNIIAMRIETPEGIPLAEYTPEYFAQLRKAYKNSRRKEAWIFTEKGLFMYTDEISRRYNDSERIKEYYRSDEAVEDLRKLLESAAE